MISTKPINRYLLIISAYAVISLGCSSNATSSEDSLAVDTSFTSTIDQDDSLQMAKKYGASLGTAYGKAKFGISEDAFQKLYSYNDQQQIGEYSYIINPLTTTDESKVYGVDIFSTSQSANYIDADIKQKMDNLIEVIKEKYSTPTSDFGEPQFFRFKPGYIQWAVGWDIANKHIRIGMGEDSAGSQYYAICRVWDGPLKAHQDSLDSNKETSTRKKDANNF